MKRRDFNDRHLFLDTNILFDAVLAGRPESDEACRVLQRCNSGTGDMAFAASTSLKDVYYIMAKRVGKKEALEAIKHLMDLIVVAPISFEDCDISLNSNEPDFEDGLIRACAELNDADIILTRDKAAFQKSFVRSMTCAEYLAIAV